MNELLKPLLGKLSVFAKKRMGFSHPPKLFLKQDVNNSNMALGKTAYYDPEQESVTLYVTKRHPKDILRSFAHELVHHTQKLRGEFDQEVSTEPGYAQKDSHMRNMEKEAYLQGNMCFRDWEDTLDNKDIYTIKIAESKFLKENKTMTTKITKDFLKEMIEKALKEQPEFIRKKPGETIDNAANDELSVKEMLRLLAQQRQQTGGGVEVGPDVRTAAQLDLPVDTEPSEEEEVTTAMQEGDCKISAGVRDEDEYMAEEIEDIDEGKAHGECKNGCQCEPIQENEELEEASADTMDNSPPRKKANKLDFAPKAIRDKENEKTGYTDPTPSNESKIQTPEQESTLYEQRFTPKNNRLFEKLLKEWTK